MLLMPSAVNHQHIHQTEWERNKERKEWVWNPAKNDYDADLFWWWIRLHFSLFKINSTEQWTLNTTHDSKRTQYDTLSRMNQNEKEKKKNGVNESNDHDRIVNSRFLVF